MPAAAKKSVAPAAAPAPAAVAPPPPPMPAPVVVPEAKKVLDSASDTDGGANDPQAITSRFSAVLEKVQAVNNMIKEIGLLMKTLQKDVAKYQKTKRSAKKDAGDKTGAKRPASGFAKPTKLSPELAKFLGVTADTMLARTEVTRLLNKYIKTNNLQDAKDRRKINPNASLSTILKMTPGTDLTYFNLQAHIKHHFVPTPVAAA
jgi:chromatin remodeling complex protein RSC6